MFVLWQLKIGILTPFEVFIEAGVNNWIEGAVGKCYVVGKKVEFIKPRR